LLYFGKCCVCGSQCGNVQYLIKLDVVCFYGRVMVFNAIFNNISITFCRLVLAVEETGVPGKNNRPDVSHWHTLSHNGVSSTPHHERDSYSQRYRWYAL